ncbi:Aste57867_13875 [Aphanomyces stellatus]|uniref:Aste57867_13875 protein n=1 Tax=Aphanomyces stellatus TaxID=120398 RepID=A0A485L1F6_9STRA|nr:hypothetical protein As57867_013824 [Aphanomyces stellatus]VFT90706.1 Aste57867_13875 [Aphanomyces stellatus]
MGYDRCLSRTGSIRFMESECALARSQKLSKFPPYKSAPDVIASFRLKQHQQQQQQHGGGHVDVSARRPVQLTSPHRSFRTNDSQHSIASSCPTTHMEPAMQDIDWQDVVDVDVETCLELTSDMVNDTLSLVFPNLDVASIDAVRALMLHRDHGFGTFKFDVLALAACLPPHTSSLVLVSHAVFTVMAFDGLDMDILLDWVRAIDATYDPAIPYHNADHAADVLHSLYCIFLSTQLRSILSEPMQMAGLLAAITHDAAHFGRTNAFLTQSKHALSVQYPVCCPLEAMHAAVGLDVLSHHNVLAHLPTATQDELRHVMDRAIFTTSLCEQKNLLAALRALENKSSPDFALVLLQAAVHAADLGQTTKPFGTHRRWVERLLEELFCEGDAERALGWSVPAFRDRAMGFSAGGQVYFMENLVLPVFTALHETLEGGLDQVLLQLGANISQWKA